jgi:hypothetical protein
MTVGRLSVLSWSMFVVMSIAFVPLCAVAESLDGVPGPVRHGLAVGVIVFWWAWFGYGMYLSMAVMRNGDKRLLKRGIRGTAEVLTAEPTNTVIQAGEFAWEAPRVWKYGLRVHLPGRDLYDTTARICADQFRVGETVPVAAAPHNLARVTIDPGTAPARHGDVAASHLPPVILGSAAGSGDGQRLHDLERLGELHAKGVLTDDEFAREKARILGGS